MKKAVTLFSFVSVTILILLFGTTVLAQTGESTSEVMCESDVVVQADDWLSKIADKFFGDLFAFPVIVEATNAKSGEDNSYTFIENPDVIEPGWKLCIPTVEDAQAGLTSSSTSPPQSPSGLQGFDLTAPKIVEYRGTTFEWQWDGQSAISDNIDWYFDIKIFTNSLSEFPYTVFVAEPENTSYVNGVWNFEGTADFRCGSHWAVQIAARNPDGSYAGPLSPESERLPIGPGCSTFSSPVEP